MNILNLPIKVYVINLKTRPRRLISVLEELKKIDLPLDIHIFNAITPNQAKQLEKKFVDYNAYKNLRGNYSTLVMPTYGALGCAISHYKVWQLCQDNPFSLIIEDDILITDPIKLRFAIIKAINCINLNIKYKLIPPRDFYCNDPIDKKRIASVYIFDPIHIYTTFEDATFYNHYYNHHKFDFKQNIFGIKQPFTGTHFYLINDLAAKLLTNTILPFEYQVDLQLGLYAHNYSEDLYLYGINNTGVRQSINFSSDVQFSFLEKKKFYKAFLKYEKNLNNSILDQIYSYMPKKKKYNYYDYY